MSHKGQKDDKKSDAPETDSPTAIMIAEESDVDIRRSPVDAAIHNAETAAAQVPVQYMKPAKGFTRYIACSPTLTLILENKQTSKQIVQGDKVLETEYSPERKLVFKGHICDVDATVNALIKEKEKGPHLQFGVSIIPAKLLGMLLDDDNDEIIGKGGVPYGGRAKALNFLNVMANNSIAVGAAKTDKTADEFKLKFITEWQRKLQKWGYTRASEVLENDDKVEAIAKKMGVSVDVARRILEEGLNR